MNEPRDNDQTANKDHSRQYRNPPHRFLVFMMQEWEVVHDIGDVFKGSMVVTTLGVVIE